MQNIPALNRLIKGLLAHFTHSHVFLVRTEEYFSNIPERQISNEYYRATEELWLFITTPKARVSLFSSILKSRGTPLETPLTKAKSWKRQSWNCHCAIRVRGRWHVASLPYKLILLGNSTMQLAEGMARVHQKKLEKGRKWFRFKHKVCLLLFWVKAPALVKRQGGQRIVCAERQSELHWVWAHNVPLRCFVPRWFPEQVEKKLVLGLWPQDCNCHSVI